MRGINFIADPKKHIITYFNGWRSIDKRYEMFVVA